MLKKTGTLLAAALILTSVSIAAPSKITTSETVTKAKVSSSKSFFHKVMKKLSGSKNEVKAPANQLFREEPNQFRSARKGCRARREKSAPEIIVK